MARRLPFHVTTASGNQCDFDFPLHEQTVSPMQVSQLLSALLATLDREIKVLGPVGNGDLLQALAMSLAARTRMLPGAPDQLDNLIRELVENALSAPVQQAQGNVPPDESKPVH